MEQLAAARKFVILGIILVAVVFAPPDIISQLTIIVPLYILYETIIIVWRISKKKKDKDKKADYFNFDTPADD